jgi:hypothetical protein
MQWGYLIYLLPLWFGWFEMGRYRALAGSGKQTMEALLAFMVALTIVVATPAGWLWFYPPEQVSMRAGLAVTIAQYAFALIVVAGLLRLLATIVVWRMICNWIDRVRVRGRLS